MAGLYVTLLRLLVTLAVLETARASGVRQTPYQRNVQMDGRQLTAAPLFQASALSTAHCGIQCSQLDGCRSFTFSANQTTSCRGYDVTMTSSNVQDTEPAAGAKTFEVVMAVSGWLETPCSADSECQVDQSECFKGLCLCTPGYYFSVGSKTCHPNCPLADLGGDFVKYQESALSSTVIWESTVSSLSECRDRCLYTATNCLSLNYNAAALNCRLKQDTARTVLSGDLVRDYPMYDHYQRTCA